MKTVWVNRHNADGSVKPMSEWVCKEVNSRITHSEAVEGNRSKFFIFSANEAKKSGLSNLEYIGDQRGDGWLYVADGDLPPEVEDEYILVQTRMGKYATTLHELSDWIVFSRIHGKPICWQPIQQPKFIGECDV